MTDADFFTASGISIPCGVIGAGGHAKVVVSTLRAAGETVLGCFDDDETRRGQSVVGAPVLGDLNAAAASGSRLILAVGSNAARKRIADRLGGVAWAVARHPRALYEAELPPGDGTLVALGAMVQCEARIGAHVILNTGSIVEHDCDVGDYVHIGPGAKLAGAVTIEEGAFIGLGAQVLPGVRVGAWAVVGAGATVNRDIPPGQVWAGTPARKMRDV